MKKYKIKDGFKCDRQSKYDFTASTVNYLESIYPNKEITLVFKELDEDGNLVDFGSKNVSKTSSADLVMFFNGTKYIVELKERWGKYHSTFYGKENDKEGWILEQHKKEALLKNNGIPLYVNLYPNNVVRVWNLNKIKDCKMCNITAPKTTVIKSKHINKNSCLLYNKDSILFSRKRGEKSNGIWEKGATN